MFGANLVILTQICDVLLCGHAEFPKILRQKGKNDIEGQSKWPPFSIPGLNKSSQYNLEFIELITNPFAK